MAKYSENLTWIDIDTKALTGNVAALKKRLSEGVRVMGVVKGNAYGHGMLLVAKATEKSVDYFGVFDFTDALVLRKSGVNKPILVLCPANKLWIDEAVAKNIELTATSCRFLSEVEKSKLPKGKKLKIHLNIETGLGRDGFVASEMGKAVKIISQSKNLSITGLMTHFSGAENREFDSYTKMQVDNLLVWKSALNAVGIYPIVNASGTAGSILNKNYQQDLVRLGIGLYGLWPSDETKKLDKKLILKPVLSWKTKIVELKKLPKGNPIAYNQTHKLTRDSVIAVIPVGYFDGVPRGASSTGKVIVRGKLAPQVGRIMMNMCVIDVTDIPGVKVGDTVTIIGSDGKVAVFADDWAAWSDSINYEIVTRLNPSTPRISR